MMTDILLAALIILAIVRIAQAELRHRELTLMLTHLATMLGDWYDSQER